MYWDFRHGSKLPVLEEGQELWMRLVRNLLDNDSAWGSGLWYVLPRRKAFLLWPPEFKQYLTRWDGPVRFFSGEEPEGYTDDPSNTEICELNCICNYDPDVMPLLAAPYGSAFARGKNGKFEKAAFPRLD